jgi:hypothetical protein
LKTKTIALVGLLGLAALAGAFCVPHRVWSYSGPGTMRDGGILSYPRYRLDLPTVAVRQSFQSFTFSGVPSEEMSVMLYVPGGVMDDIDKVEGMPLQITVRLFEEATASTPRRLLCTAIGKPRVPIESEWVVTGSYNSLALYHCRCLRVPMSAGRRYTLDLEIAGSDPSGLLKAVVPALEGGGFELP